MFRNLQKIESAFNFRIRKPLIMQRSVRTYCDHEGTVKNIICEFRTEKNPNALSHSQVLFDQFLKYITNYDKGIMTLKN